MVGIRAGKGWYWRGSWQKMRLGLEFELVRDGIRDEVGQSCVWA